MSTVRIHTRNVTRVFRAATDQDRMQGRAWYSTANQLARELDPTDPTRAAAVIAVLSPMTPWPRNVQLARDAYAGREIRTMGRNADKARRIIAGEDPDAVVSGVKVRAFWRTIADPASVSDTVVVDRHATDIAAGRVLGDITRSRYLGLKGSHETVATAYRRAARILSREFGPVTPAEVQAITWTYWRRERAVAYHA